MHSHTTIENAAALNSQRSSTESALLPQQDCTTSALSDPRRSRTGSAPEPQCFRTRPGVSPHRERTDSAVIPHRVQDPKPSHRIRSSSALAPRQNRTVSLERSETTSMSSFPRSGAPAVHSPGIDVRSDHDATAPEPPAAASSSTRTSLSCRVGTTRRAPTPATSVRSSALHQRAPSPSLSSRDTPSSTAASMQARGHAHGALTSCDRRQQSRPSTSTATGSKSLQDLPTDPATIPVGSRFTPAAWTAGDRRMSMNASALTLDLSSPLKRLQMYLHAGPERSRISTESLLHAGFHFAARSAYRRYRLCRGNKPHLRAGEYLHTRRRHGKVDRNDNVERPCRGDIAPGLNHDRDGTMRSINKRHSRDHAPT